MATAVGIFNSTHSGDSNKYTAISSVEEIDAGDESTESDSLLVVSPYTTAPHLLDLNRYDTASQLFAKALTILRPTHDDYATTEYTSTFNFQEVVDTLRKLARAESCAWQKKEFYVVSFRSQLKHEVDGDRLFQLDAFSHQEAMTSGGLLKYWYGVKNEDRRNLATCFWESRQHARDGGRGPWHAQARAAATIWYESIVFKTYVLTIGDGANSWEFRDYEESRR
ncbi:hypothetical protein D6C90_05636 [Aureobasidium pullulans]|uniref:Uncharacterized protein n=1 Tax=Aureobasidium pullulans TaxID=5580 RepID=A0A4S9UQV3_AURPU|nr:hypothetical protein D6C90_05636 [Aureobasidium pullulans]